MITTGAPNMAWIALGKPWVALLITVSAVFGSLLTGRWEVTGMALAAAGTFFMAAGASGLNQIQELQADSLMARTAGRPLPSGRISTRIAGTLTVFCLLAGIIFLARLPSPVPLILGIAAVLIYNGVYTLLKPVTAFAALPGACIGAIPPAIGWTAAGGTLDSPSLHAVAIFFFLWQIPHFWLLMLRHESDYRRAGFPVLSDRFGRIRTLRLITIWTTATSIAGMSLPLFFPFHSVVPVLLLTAAALWISLSTGRLARSDPPGSMIQRVFHQMTVYAVVVIIILSSSRLAGQVINFHGF